MIFVIVCFVSTGLLQLTTQSALPAPPIQRDGWILPAQQDNALPIWGIADGIRIGLWPTNGPRGLIRIYAPYLDNPPDQVINFIAVEPIVAGRRGFSELEHSRLDNVAGKRMWTIDELVDDPQTRLSTKPARGRLITIDGVEALSFYIVVEPFTNGARPIVQVVLRKDRPHEVMFRTYSAQQGAKMDACILTATMGNYARLRKLHLKDRIIQAKDLWPDFASKDPWGGGFARPLQWGIEQMTIRDGFPEVWATPDEADPSQAQYAPDTPDWWRYRGKVAT